MSSILHALYRASMGCFCSKESVLLDGQAYAVLDHLAEGGFSNIDLVEHPRTRERFALKRIVCHSTEDQIAANKEIDYHKALDHSGILKCLASSTVGTADIVHNKTSEVMLLLPFYKRGTLHDDLMRRMPQKQHFAEDFALKLFLKVCKAVKHMHEQDPPLAHRDIKPHNVLLDKNMNPILMDLGSVSPARVTVRTHSQAQRLQDEAGERCSMPYRPPELFQVDSVCDIDERTDVWSLGCLLYAIMFFKSPYDAVFERGDSVALAVQSATLTFPADSPYSVDAHNLVAWMLTPEQVVRPHLGQIISRLEEMTQEREVARPSTVAVRASAAPAVSQYTDAPVDALHEDTSVGANGDAATVATA